VGCSQPALPHSAGSRARTRGGKKKGKEKEAGRVAGGQRVKILSAVRAHSRCPKREGEGRRASARPRRRQPIVLLSEKKKKKKGGGVQNGSAAVIGLPAAVLGAPVVKRKRGKKGSPVVHTGVAREKGEEKTARRAAAHPLPASAPLQWKGGAGRAVGSSGCQKKRGRKQPWVYSPSSFLLVPFSVLEKGGKGGKENLHSGHFFYSSFSEEGGERGGNAPSLRSVATPHA